MLDSKCHSQVLLLELVVWLCLVLGASVGPGIGLTGTLHLSISKQAVTDPIGLTMGFLQRAQTGTLLSLLSLFMLSKQGMVLVFVHFYAYYLAYYTYIAQLEWNKYFQQPSSLPKSNQSYYQTSTSQRQISNQHLTLDCHKLS